MVLRGLTTIWSLATLPTSRSPFSLTATTLGRMSAPLSLGTTRATLLRTYATHVLVVPRSMPRMSGLSAAMASAHRNAQFAERARKATSKARWPCVRLRPQTHDLRPRHPVAAGQVHPLEAGGADDLGIEEPLQARAHAVATQAGAIRDACHAVRPAGE